MQLFAYGKWKLTTDHVSWNNTIQQNTYLNSYRYLLTCTDRGTHLIEVQPLSEITAPSINKDIYTHMDFTLCCRRQKETIWNWFLELSKVIRLHGLRTAYHPQCNGLIERTHRTVKMAIIVISVMAKSNTNQYTLYFSHWFLNTNSKAIGWLTQYQYRQFI